MDRSSHQGLHSPLEDDEGENHKGEKKVRSASKLTTQGTVCSSIFILLTTCIGAGTLSLPYAFAQGGVIFSSVVFLIIMVSPCLVKCTRCLILILKG